MTAASGKDASNEEEDLLKKERIVVVGAAGVGLVFSVPRIPDSGETLIASAVRIMSGGKSANQAIGAACLGAQVALISAVGRDALAGVVKEALESHGVDSTGLVVFQAGTTMVGAVLVEASGENRIALAPGVLDALTPDQVTMHEELIAEADLCLVGLDGMPSAPAIEALHIARRHGVRTVFNPAPAPSSADIRALLSSSDYITPNESEAAAMCGESAPPEELARQLQALGATNVVITLGARGVHLATDDESQTVPTSPVSHVVDTSGAGDAFNAAFAVSLARGLSAAEACIQSCRAASLIVQGPGFVDALHLWEDFEI